AGASLVPAILGGEGPRRDRLLAQNDRNLAATWDHSYKVVASPEKDRLVYALFDRKRDRGETRDVADRQGDALRAERRALDLLLEQIDREWARTRPLLEGKPGEGRLSPEACERLKAMGYIQQGCP